jgi:hypothetical protein
VAVVALTAVDPTPTSGDADTGGGDNDNGGGDVGDATGVTDGNGGDTAALPPVLVLVLDTLNDDVEGGKAANLGRMETIRVIAAAATAAFTLVLLLAVDEVVALDEEATLVTGVDRVCERVGGGPSISRIIMGSAQLVHKSKPHGSQ